MKTKPERPYIDFYKKHEVSPVAQDISDLKKHYERREFLYRRLGIIASWLKDKSVIEFGPGSGHNALYTYSLQPSKYVLVEGNPTGLKECTRLLQKEFPGEKRYEIIESLIEEYSSDELFDLVICEGLIPAQKDPANFTRNIARFTKLGGVCIITCHDAVGLFADLLRCLIGTIVIEEGMLLDKKVEILISVFKKHLKNLKGMSRSPRDWAIDQIINKALWRDSSLFSVENAIDSLDDSFDIYGASPSIFTDWRWYKDVFGDQCAFNALGKECYRKNLHNFLDYRYEFAPRPVADNLRLMDHCHSIWRSIVSFGFKRDRKHIDTICKEMLKLEINVQSFSPGTACALADFSRVLKEYPTISPETDWGRFAEFWGRGTQYLSFIRMK